MKPEAVKMTNGAAAVASWTQNYSRDRFFEMSPNVDLEDSLVAHLISTDLGQATGFGFKPQFLDNSWAFRSLHLCSIAF